MALSNAQRQARFRERKRIEAQQHMERFLALSDAALETVARIDSGWRHFIQIGDEPLREYTDELRAEKVAEAQRYADLTKLWAKDVEA